MQVRQTLQEIEDKLKELGVSFGMESASIRIPEFRQKANFKSSVKVEKGESMRHRRKGRVLGRSPSHQRAMLRNLASSLVLTEREFEPGEVGAPKGCLDAYCDDCGEGKRGSPISRKMYYDCKARDC